MVDLKQGLQSTLGPSFTVERELTGGGMSRVFVAMDSALGRRVVVKVLPPELAATVSVERFKREIMLAATLQHPHIVGVLSAGEIDGMPYFTMPFVEGESLRARIEREGQMAVGRVVSILKDSRGPPQRQLAPSTRRPRNLEKRSASAGSWKARCSAKAGGSASRRASPTPTTASWCGPTYTSAN